MKLTLERSIRLHRIFKKIKDHYGKSKYCKFDTELYIYHDPNDSTLGEYGPIPEWFTAEVSLNLASCNTEKFAVKVLIHEYMHYLQSPTWYTRYLNTHGYDDHPYEKEAWDVANRDINLFI